MTTISAHAIRCIAVEAECDPRSVRHYLDGSTIRPMTAERIRRALKVLGHTDPNEARP